MCKQLLLSRYCHYWAAVCFMTQNTYGSRANSFYINITTLRYDFLYNRSTFFCVKYQAARILGIHASSSAIGGGELKKGTVMIWEDSHRPRILRFTWLWGQEGFFFCKEKHQGIFIKENGHKKWKEVHWKWCDYFPLRLYWVKGCQEKKIHVSGIARIFIRLVTKGGTSYYDVLQYPPLLLNSNWMRRT